MQFVAKWLILAIRIEREHNTTWIGIKLVPASQDSYTKVQTIGELRMRDTANWWAGPIILVYVYSR